MIKAVRSLLGVAGLVAATIASTAPASANYFGGDRPVAVDIARMPQFDAVGAVFRKGDYDRVGGNVERLGQGTGTLIDACNIITVKHVVTDAAVPTSADKVVFAVGGAGLPDRAVGTPVAWGSVAVQGGGTDGWVKLQLDHCLGQTHGFLPLASLDAASALTSYAGRLAVLGYSTAISGARTLHGDMSCSLRSLESTGNWRNDCSIPRGFSGGPMVANFGGQWKIVGLVRGQNIVVGEMPVGATASSSTSSPAYYELPSYSDAWSNVALPMSTILRGN